MKGKFEFIARIGDRWDDNGLNLERTVWVLFSRNMKAGGIRSWIVLSHRLRLVGSPCLESRSSLRAA